MAKRNDSKIGWDLKGKMFELVHEIIETIKDSTGVNWMLDNGLNKMWDVVVVLILWYIRCLIKLGIFICVVLLIMALLFPHSSAKFW
jgi:hypothetical protein